MTTWTAPGGWAMTEDGNRLRVRRHGRWVGDILPDAVLRNAGGYDQTCHHAPTPEDAMRLLSAPATPKWRELNPCPS